LAFEAIHIGFIDNRVVGRAGLLNFGGFQLSYCFGCLRACVMPDFKQPRRGFQSFEYDQGSVRRRS